LWFWFGRARRRIAYFCGAVAVGFAGGVAGVVAGVVAGGFADGVMLIPYLVQLLPSGETPWLGGSVG